MKLISILKEIQIVNNVTDDQIIELFAKLWNRIEDYWEEDNQDVMTNMDIKLSKINKKYFGYEIIDSLTEEQLNDLNRVSKVNYYRELLKFYNEIK